MESAPFFHSTATYVPASECMHLLGDNSGSDRLNPWDLALSVLYFSGANIVGPGNQLQKFSRHYTIRPAKFPQDSKVAKDILSEQIASPELAGPQGSVDRIIHAHVVSDVGQIFLVCAILVEGGSDEDSMIKRLDRASKEVHRPHPMPKGASAISVTTEDPSGGYYVLLADLPPPILDEEVVGFLSTKTLGNDSRTGAVELGDGKSIILSQSEDQHLSARFRGLLSRKSQSKNDAVLACELDRLFVKDSHHKCLEYALVDTVISYMKERGIAFMTLNPSEGGLRYAKEIFERAGADPTNAVMAHSTKKDDHGVPLQSPNLSVVQTRVSKDKLGNAGEALTITLAKWPGPLHFDDALKIMRRERQRKAEAQDNRGEPVVAKKKTNGSKLEPVAYCDNTTSPYRYITLDETAHEIRVLTLSPGPLDSDIRVSLENYEMYRHGLSEVLRYEALSYCWGPTEDLKEIYIGKGNRTISITNSLAQALLHLRSPDEPRDLWVDAICVNQADLQERGSQINRMAEIYKKAERVIVWLGPDTLQSTEAMGILSRIGSRVDVDWFTHTIRTYHDPPSESPNESHMHGLENISSSFAFGPRESHCLLHLLSRSWFERLWIWQEIRLASEKSIIQCGFHSISWEDFSNAIFLITLKNYRTATQAPPQDKSSLGSKVKLAYRICDKGVEDFKSLFEMTRFSKCSDARDRVYSLLSLFDDLKAGLHVKPDYTKTIYEVYKDAALRMFMNLGKLDILASAELREEEDEPKSGGHWSSWVPDWTKARRTSPILHAFAAHASCAEVSQHGPAIRMAGVTVAEISDLCPFDEATLNPGKLSELTETSERYEASRKNLLRIAEYFFRGQQPSEPHLASFCRTLLAGEDSDNVTSQLGTQRVSFRMTEQIMNRLLKAGHHTTAAQTASEREVEELTLAHVLTYCEARSLLRLPDGNFGFVPRVARAGDIIVVSLGCDSPLVLRPSHAHAHAYHNQHQYRVVGEAYCDGLMDGAALLGPLPIDHHGLFAGIDARSSSFYRNAVKNGEIRVKDERLGALPPGWVKRRFADKSKDKSRDEDKDGEPKPKFGYVNKGVGGGGGGGGGAGAEAITSHDPRLTSSWLKEQGVDVQTFELI